MDGISLMRNLRFLLLGFLIPVTLFLISPSIYAANFAAQSIIKAVATPTGAIVSTEYAAMKAANQSVYAVRAVQVSKATIAQVVRTRSFTPWGVALAAAVVAAGYALEDGEIQTIPQSDSQFVQGYYWKSAYSNNRQKTPNESLSYVVNFYSGGVSNTSLTLKTETTAEMTYTINSNNYTRTEQLQRFPCGSITSDYCVGGAPQTDSEPLSDNQLYDIATSLPSTQFQKLFEDPLSGQPNRDIQEIKDVATDISNDYNAENDEDPLTVPTTNPETGDTGTETVSEEKPEKEDFCIKNPSSLACSELDDVPEKTELQTQELEMNFSQHSLASNASCPAPIQLPHGAEMSYQPACDLASGIKPIVLVIATLGALFIVGGFKEKE
jgi:hypothetical protein